jgi:hypothetical protein
MYSGAMKRTVLLIAVIFLLGNSSRILGAQDITVEDLDRRRNRINAAGMLTLGSWALANIGANTALYFSTDEDIRYFYQMNVLWNFINLGVAGLGYYGSVRAVPRNDLFAAVDAQYNLEKVLLLNAGLDAAYIMTGFFLMEYGRSFPSRKTMFRGYGQSLLLQGGFLLVFDLVMYGIQRGSRKLLEPLLNE